MRFTPTRLEGPVLIDLDVFADDRGGFARSFCVDEFSAAGLPSVFPQANLSMNRYAGTLRGLHFNAEPWGESKVVRAVRGAIRDVIVDLRSDSPTKFEWEAVELSADSGRALFIPGGFAHGFITLEEPTDVHYLMGAAYQPTAARVIAWNDPSLAVDWGQEPLVMSDRDRDAARIDPESFDLATFGG